MTDADFLRSIKPLPLAIAGHVQQPSRKYYEFHDGDYERLQQIASRYESLLEACKAAQYVWDEGCVDRGYKDEHNWIDAAKNKIDAAIAKAQC